MKEEKMKGIKYSPISTSVTELRGFLEPAGYYRRFIKNFVDNLEPLQAETSSKNRLEWTDEMYEAFKVLKEVEITPPVLSFPEFFKPFIVEIDASSDAIGAVLVQRNMDGKVHPITFASRTMTEVERKYEICERKALAAIFALKKFRVYLLSSRPLFPVTNHQALSYALKRTYIRI